MWIRQSQPAPSHRIPINRPAHIYARSPKVIYPSRYTNDFPLTHLDSMYQDAPHVFYNYNTLLVINHQGAIRQLYTPIKVLCIDPIGNIKIGIWVYIDEIRTTLKDELVYLINGKEYFHGHFAIQIGF